jgi:hypothetical protein
MFNLINLKSAPERVESEYQFTFTMKYGTPLFRVYRKFYSWNYHLQSLVSKEELQDYASEVAKVMKMLNVTSITYP